jgi:Cdc6-like AAA superfamily ATPase
MTRRLPKTTRPFAPGQRHGQAICYGPTGTAKTALLARLAKMNKLTVNELVQRYKLS